MVNHPNRSKRWTKDGDQWVWTGTLGTYRITEWQTAAGSNFAISIERSGRGRKGIGEFSSLNNAKSAADTYDNYRAA